MLYKNSKCIIYFEMKINIQNIFPSFYSVSYLREFSMANKYLPNTDRDYATNMSRLYASQYAFLYLLNNIYLYNFHFINPFSSVQSIIF